MNNYAVLKNKMKFEFKIPYQNIPKLYLLNMIGPFQRYFVHFHTNFFLS